MRRFLMDDTGAVTIDWVALTAGLVIMGVLLVQVFNTEVQNVVNRIKSELQSATSGTGVN